MSLPIHVIEIDHQLESAASKASEELARHRWHWTLDESNPEHVGIRAYARAVGRDPAAIHRYAHGYAGWSVDQGSTPLSEFIARAHMSAERQQIVEAVADANQVAFTTARDAYGPDISRVRDAVERAAERQPDMTADGRAAYARRTAENLARSRATEQERIQDRKRQRTATFMQLDARLDQMRRSGIDALNIARDAELGQEEIELLETAVAAVRAVIALLDSAITGASNVDWDSELAKLSKEA